MQRQPNPSWWNAEEVTKTEPEKVTCNKCGCNWMSLVMVQQFPKHHSVILGQKPHPISDIGFYMFQCPKCNELYEPNINIGPRDSAQKGYNQFLDKMEEEVKGEKV